MTKTCPKFLQKTKFFVQNDDHKVAIQEWLFENGCTWNKFYGGEQKIKLGSYCGIYVDENGLMRADTSVYYFSTTSDYRESFLGEMGEDVVPAKPNKEWMHKKTVRMTMDEILATIGENIVLVNKL